MTTLRILILICALSWTGVAIIAQSNDVLAERIQQHDRQIQDLRDMNLAERLTRIETQMGAVSEDIGTIKELGKVAAGSILALVAEALFRLLSSARNRKETRG